VIKNSIDRPNTRFKNQILSFGIGSYDNYMAQMQTLIKQKAIEALGAKKLVEILVSGIKVISQCLNSILK